MEFDIYFPLFDRILQGDLNPQRSVNAVTQNYTVRLREQIVAPNRPVGTFALTYLHPFNEKCSYYHRIIIPETIGYCEDMLLELSLEADARIRSYMRHTILDGHLTSCLMLLGDVIKENNYRLDELAKPSADADMDRLSNIYIFHLLKVCVAKAYMEVQDQLKDVVSWKYSEEVLYTSHVKELPPVKCFLIRREKSVMPKGKVKTDEKENEQEVVLEKIPSEIVVNGFAETCFNVQQVSKKLNKTDKTVYRKIKSEEIKATFDGSKFWIDKNWFSTYMASLEKK